MEFEIFDLTLQLGCGKYSLYNSQIYFNNLYGFSFSFLNEKDELVILSLQNIVAQYNLCVVDWTLFTIDGGGLIKPNFSVYEDPFFSYEIFMACREFTDYTTSCIFLELYYFTTLGNYIIDYYTDFSHWSREWKKLTLQVSKVTFNLCQLYLSYSGVDFKLNFFTISCWLESLTNIQLRAFSNLIEFSIIYKWFEFKFNVGLELFKKCW